MLYDVIDSDMVLVVEGVELREQEVIDLEGSGYICFLLRQIKWAV